MESKHTPGPWVIDHEDNRILASDDRKTIICHMSASLRNQEVMRDAQIIASAPDLLTASMEALSAMESIWATKGHDDDWIYDEMGSELASGYFSLRSAIAKAKGTINEA